MRPPYAYRKSGSLKPRTVRSNPEHKLQVDVVRYLTYVLPEGALFTASLAGVHLGAMQRDKASAAGLRPGWPDLQLVWDRQMFFIELKKPLTAVPRDRGRLGTLDDPGLSDDQRDVLYALPVGSWAVCRSVEEVGLALSRWRIPCVPYVWA